MTDFLPPETTSIEEVNKIIEKTRLEHIQLIAEIAQARSVLAKSKLEVTNLQNELIRVEAIIEKSKYLIDEAKQLHLTREVQRKQLDDHHEWLKKEHNRIQDWDKAVSNREEALRTNTTKHYVLDADTGLINGNFQ